MTITRPRIKLTEENVKNINSVLGLLDELYQERYDVLNMIFDTEYAEEKISDTSEFLELILKCSNVD